MATNESNSHKNVFLYKVYAWMSVALSISGLTAFFIANTPPLLVITLQPITMLIITLATFVLAMIIQGAIKKISFQMMVFCYLLYAFLLGALLSIIFIVFTHASVYSTFFITAGMFAGVSFYGYFTKSDLSTLGSYAIMMLWGIVLASFMNFFWQNSMFHFLVSILGVIVFTALTAFDTQGVKQMAERSKSLNPCMLDKSILSSAFILYLDFINLFLFLLRVLGSRKK